MLFLEKAARCMNNSNHKEKVFKTAFETGVRWSPLTMPQNTTEQSLCKRCVFHHNCICKMSICTDRTRTKNISDKWYQNLYNNENYRINIYLGKNQMYYSIPCRIIKTKRSSTFTTHAWKATGKSSLTHIFPLNCQATANVTISNVSWPPCHYRVRWMAHWTARTTSCDQMDNFNI